MVKPKAINLIIFCVAMASGCCPEKMKDEVTRQPATDFILKENFSGLMIADTIIYDVIIKNPNPEDKWTEECLMNLEKEQFIDILFESVYEKQAIAYDLFTEKIITPNKLKELERKKDYDRHKIGKIQFAESWFYNDSLRLMSKKVISVSLGYEIFDETGNLIGYKPAFKIYLN